MKIISYFRKADKIKALSLALSFAVPTAVLLIAYLIKGVAPFGSKTLCSMDGFSQYYPMLMNMTEAVKEGELFYSFKGALGFNLWAQSAYYTNSPLWLPLYFLPHTLHVNYIDMITLFKISLGSLFFCIRLVKSYNYTSYKKSLFVFPVLSSAWALSGYMCAFINQFMWADVVILLPLVVMGIENLVRNKKPTLYIISLFLSIFSCFYLSFMVCIFSVLWFFFLIFREKTQWRDRFGRAVLFGISSLIAGGMSAVVIIPVYKALSLTKASDLGFDGNLSVNYSLKDFLLRLLPFQDTSLAYDKPNLYCTLTVVVLFIFFLFSKKFSRRQRICTFIFVSFMFLTMSINLGEYIWHGFHFPNQLPARQSFLVIFLLIAVAAEFLTKIKINTKHLYGIVAVILIGSCANFIYQFSACVWTSAVNSLCKYEYIMKDFTVLDDEDTFARMEWADVKKNNYPQQYCYNGINYYSSTMTGDSYDFFQNIGMERYAKNVSVCYKESDILNAVFSVKYIMSGDSGQNIRKNKDVLSLAFTASEDVLSFTSDEYENAEKAQSAFWDSLCGKEGITFKDGYKVLSQNQLEIDIFDTDYISGTITSEKDSLLFTSIPYDEGWEIFIDGEKAETKKSAGYFLSCSIKEGAHDVVFKYTVPGIKAGAVVSVISAIAFAGLIILRKKENE